MAMKPTSRAPLPLPPAAKAQAVAAKAQRIRVLESELQALQAAESDTLAVGVDEEDDEDETEKNGENAAKMRMLPAKAAPHHVEDELYGAAPGVNMDPLACLCELLLVCDLCVLRESREIKDGEVRKSMVIIGPHWIGVVVTLAIILVATGAFLTQQCARLAWYYTLFTLGFCGLTLYYLFETSCRDPGILLPLRYRDAKDAHGDDDDDDTGAAGESDMENGEREQLQSDLLSQRSSSAAVTSLVTPSRFAAPTRTRLCDICGVVQDQYTEHCDDCDVCIDEYDHHCPWMGKCIGRKNLRAFKLFNLSWVLYVVFVLAVAIQNVEWADMAIQRLEKTASGSWMPVPRTHQP